MDGICIAKEAESSFKGLRTRYNTSRSVGGSMSSMASSGLCLSEARIYRACTDHSNPGDERVSAPLLPSYGLSYCQNRYANAHICPWPSGFGQSTFASPTNVGCLPFNWAEPRGSATIPHSILRVNSFSFWPKSANFKLPGIVEMDDCYVGSLSPSEKDIPRSLGRKS